jgi:ligand-binding sensor domain-containing protein
MDLMQSLRSGVISGLVFLTMTNPASALDPNMRITQYRHTAWRVQEGAFASPPNAIAQTADGYIWLGTGSGLVRYDGARFSPWSPPAARSLTGAIIEGAKAGHRCLPGIRERAKRIGARLDIWSEAGAGTELELTVPASRAYAKPQGQGRFGLFRKKARVV